MRDHGMTKSRAIATAVNRCKKWAAGGPDVSPEVQAAAQKAIAEWEAAKARARSTPSRSNDMSVPVDLAWDPGAHPRAAAGSPAGGQFVAASSSQQKGQDKKGKGKNERERLINSLLSKKGADYQRLAKAEAAKKGGKGKKSGDRKKLGKSSASGAHLTAKVGGAQSKELPARKLKLDRGTSGSRFDRADSSNPRSRHARGGLEKSNSGAPGGQGAEPTSPGSDGSLRLIGGVSKDKARQAVQKAYKRNAAALRAHAKGQGWRKRGDWYVTMQRREGSMMTVGVRQSGLGFQVSRNGQVNTYRTLAQATRAAAA